MSVGDSILPGTLPNPAPVRKKRWRAVPPPPPTVALTGAPPKPPAATESWKPGELSGERRAQPGFLLGVPPWLISLTVHLLLLVGLAFGSVAERTRVVGTVITSRFAEESPPLLQVEELRLEPMDEAESLPGAAEAAELAMTDVTEIGPEVTSGTAEVAGPELDAVSDIGGLFSGSGAGLSETGDSPLKAAEFFGIKAAGRKFVFIVDSSRSMRNGKFEAAKEELEYAIRRLSPEQSFYVIFFNDDAERMHFLDEFAPEPDAVLATNENLTRAVKWMKTVTPEARTDPSEAVKFALSLAPDAIYILSDGKFTDQGKTIRYLRNTNLIKDPEQGYRPRTVVHTIAFWQRAGEEAMRVIAKTHRGTYRFIPADAGQ